MHISSHHSTPPAGLNTSSLASQPHFYNALAAPPTAPESALLQSASARDSTAQPDNLKEAFHDFVGQTFFGEMIKSFRSTQQPSKYFHGGRAEEIFQGQFDQVLTEKLSDASAAKIADPMYDLFMLKRAS